MATDYSPQVPSRSELLARVLIACRDHHLPEPASISFHSPDGASMFVDTDDGFREWGKFLGGFGIVRDFYGWNLHLMVRAPWDRDVIVDEAVSDYEVTAEVFIPLTPPHEFTPRAVAVAECQVPYVVTEGQTNTIGRCARPVSHLGDHADMNRHQWANTYPAPYAPTHSAVTP